MYTIPSVFIKFSTFSKEILSELQPTLEAVSVLAVELWLSNFYYGRAKSTVVKVVNYFNIRLAKEIIILITQTKFMANHYKSSYY